MKSLIIGVEKSNFVGKCPGSELDAKNMTKILKNIDPNVKTLLNESATIENVKTSIEETLQDETISFVYYSGHGGSERFSDTGPEEVDGKDEFLCLYDGYLRDNEIWKLLLKAKGNVFLMFDCCHSETMFRSPGFMLSDNSMLPLATSGFVQGKFKEVPNALIWSGCPDNTYSYGSSLGGQFTNTFLRHFSKNDTYASLWSKIKSDMILKKYENVQETVIGNFSKDVLIFS